MITDKKEQALLPDDENTAVTDNSTLQNWQRLSPIALIYFIVKFIKGLLSNIIVLLPAIYFSSDSIMENPTLWLPVLIALLCLLLLGTFLSFYFFQYRLNNDTIEIRSGVISKKHLNLPFTRIQNVKLEQPLYYRWFNYTCLELDTAGSAKQEAKVVALKTDFAEQLKAKILATHHQEAETNLEDSSVNNSPLTTEKTLNTRSITDLVIHGLTNNRIWIFLGGLAPFLDDFGNYIVTLFQDFGIDIQQLLTIADKPLWQITLYALTLTFIVISVISLFSVAGSIITFYQYTLTKIDDKYIRRSGLFTKHEVTMRLSRLQMIVQQQDWLDVLLKRINLKFEQINAFLGHSQMDAQSNRIIVPSIKPDECASLIKDVYPENQMGAVNYQPISKRFLLKNLGFKLTPLFLIVVCFFSLVENITPLAGIIPLYVVSAGLIFMRWYRWGYASDDNYTYIRKGLLGVDYYCFPTYKTQQVQFKQSWFLKRHQLCSVNFLLAAGMQPIPYIKARDGLKLANTALYQVESTKKSWM